MKMNALAVAALMAVCLISVNAQGGGGADEQFSDDIGDCETFLAYFAFPNNDLDIDTDI
jgi:hypothetical protein